MNKTKISPNSSTNNGFAILAEWFIHKLSDSQSKLILSDKSR